MPIAASASPHSAANTTGLRISQRPARPGRPLANRINAALNKPPARPPATLHSTTAIQPRPKSSSAEVWPK
jgi:hypothetical protein